MMTGRGSPGREHGKCLPVNKHSRACIAGRNRSSLWGLAAWRRPEVAACATAEEVYSLIDDSVTAAFRGAAFFAVRL